jgi:hypothetical protein
LYVRVCLPHRLRLILHDLTFFHARQRLERRVFAALLQMVPNIKVRLTEGTDEDVALIADMVYRPLLILFCNRYD